MQQLDLKELQGNAKIIERCRPYDHLEAVTLDTQTCQVLYTEGEYCLWVRVACCLSCKSSQ